jgi:hypothetical protein
VTAPSRTGTRVTVTESRDPQHASAKSNAGWAGQGPGALWELEVPGLIGLPVVARRPATASGALTESLYWMYCTVPICPSCVEIFVPNTSAISM